MTSSVDYTVTTATQTLPGRVQAGEQVMLAVAFTDNTGAPVDPGAVTLTYGPVGTALTTVTPTRVTTGNYQMPADTTNSPGALVQWSVAWSGIGANAAACSGTFYVYGGTVESEPPVTSPYAVSVNGQSGIVVLDAAQVGADPAGASAAEMSRAEGVEAGLTTALTAKADLVGGTVPRAQLPNISGTYVTTVASQAAMLATVPPDADTLVIVFRSDVPNSQWFLNPGLSHTVLANWVEQAYDGSGAAAAAQTAAQAFATAAVSAQHTADLGLFAPLLVPDTTVHTAAFTGVAATRHKVGLAGQNVTMTLPSAPADKTLVYAEVSTWSTGFTLTVLPGSGDAFDSGAASLARSKGTGQSIWVQYQAGLRTWLELPERLPLAVLNTLFDALGAAAAAQAAAQTFATGAVAAEQTRATTAEGVLTTNLTAEVTNRGTAVTAEATARAAADAAEVTARTAAIADLSATYVPPAGKTTSSATPVAPAPVFNVKDYGAFGNGVQIADAAMTSGAALLSSTTSLWAPVNVGQQIRVVGAGTAGADLITTIQSVTDSHDAVLAAPAGTTVSGALAYYGTDDSAAIMAASAAAAAVRGVVGFPGSVNAYMADSLVMASQFVTWRGLGGPMTRFSTNTNADGSTVIRHLPGSSNTLLTMNAAGIGLENITLDGNGAPGTVWQISYGFENRIKTVRACYGTGYGLDIQGADNATWDDVFVDNCGSASAAQVRITAQTPRTINTLNMRGLNIEHAPAAAADLDINSAVNDAVTDYPYVLRLLDLHIEHASDSGGAANTGPMITAGNFTTVVLEDPYIYGGPGPLLTYNQLSTESGLGGLIILGGMLSGRTSTSGDEPATLVHLVAGDMFVMAGTVLQNFTAQGVLIDSTFGANVFIDPTCIARAGTLVTDNRTVTNPFFFNAPTRVLGPSNGVPNSQTAPRGVYQGQNTSGAPTVGIASGTKNWQIGLDETNNRLAFLLAGTRQLGYFDQYGNYFVLGGLTEAIASKSASYTLGQTGSADSTVLSTSGATLTLPTAVGATGRIFTLVNADASAAAPIATTSSQTINRLAPPTLAAGQSITVQSDGANWQLISQTNPTVTGTSPDGLTTPFVAGSYFAPSATTVGTLTLAAGQLKGDLIVSGRACTLTQIGLEIVTAASAGGVVRLGLYKFPAGSSNVANLLVDAGTIDATVVGYAELTISQAVAVGDKLLVVAACQGAPTTAPVIRSSNGALPYIGSATALTVSQNPFGGSGLSGITGALPSTHTIAGSASAARVLLKAAT